ncbi:MAG: glycosyltransferase family 39 protein, partial [Candidatus Lindowbacteria bacterium]|nr:glycosyltransferase family 39 protein [Candidatus Lindowbacteria bacterium]
MLAIAAGYIFLYLFVALSRIQYPFELEWLEGSLVDHVRRILAGQRLYVIPSLEFIPFFYTPLYFYLSAGVSKILGVGFFPLRLISFIASLGCFAVLYLIVERETKSRFSAFLSASLFAATFRASGAWFDIARVDSLFLFFLLAAVYAVRFKTSLNWTVLAGALISLSFLTKQTALIISLPIMLYCVYADWRRSIFLIGIVASVVTGTTLLLDNIHDGWYAYYIFRVPAHHAIIRNMFVDFWTKDLLLALPVACLMSAWCLYAKFSYMTRKTFLFYFLMTGGMVGASWLSRLHEGGYDNVLMTAYAALSILFGLTVHTAIRWLRTMSLGVRSPGETAIYLACIT